LYERCRSIRDEAEEAEAAIAEPRTDVRMSCPTGMMDIVAPTLPKFLRHFPKVRLHVVATDRPVTLIEDRVDVAIRVRTKLDDSTALTMRTCGVSRKLPVASPECASSLSESINDVAVAATLHTSEKTGEIEWTLISKDERVLTAFLPLSSGRGA